MQNEHQLIQQVRNAQNSIQAADELIRAYLPFVRAQTAKFLHRPPMEGQDDELSIAMIAFHEAIRSYSHSRGGFLNYAALIIRSRLIDEARRQSRHRTLSLDAPSEEGPEKTALALQHEDHARQLVDRQATRAEILELSRQIEGFGIRLTEVAENCPRQARTRDACQKALQAAKEQPELINELLRTKRLPISRLAQVSGIDRKILERHRKYLVALLVIYSNGYELIRGHLQQIGNGGEKA